MDMRIRVGVDVGGTFTDFALVDGERRRILTGKRLTTPDDPSTAVTQGLRHLLDEAAVPIAQVHSIVHGTTLVANTIIERTGAKVGLITTRGFRDSLEMGKEIRYDLYDLFLEAPPTLVPRFLRREVAERIDANGRVLLTLDEEDLRAAARGLKGEDVEAIAVCFMHAYRNPAHERRAKRLLAEEVPGVPVTLSSEVAPEIREFERASTACANAYVQPRMQRYLRRLHTMLADMGLTGALHVMLSGGGIATVEAALEHPVRLIESGPAAGAMAASFYGRLIGARNLISFDMGGTTAKMCLIDEGRPEKAHQFEAGRVRRFRKGSGLPLKVAVVEMIEIGAGGGSIAHVDRMGLLKVGPSSAGASPGPVCYGLGGREPTVTDADLLLGYLNPDYFLGGEMRLDMAAVERAIDERLARPLGLSILDAAVGVHNVVNENMATATRMHLAERGRDPRHYDLIAFGGAGPVHAYGVARLLKLRRIIVPFGAGITSALGFLVAPSAVDAVRSYVGRLDGLDWKRVNELFAEMDDEARALLLAAGTGGDEIGFRRSADMRHVGQGFEVSVPLPSGDLNTDSVPAILDAFFRTYRQLFERTIADVPIEALSWRIEASGPLPSLELNFEFSAVPSAKPEKGERKVYFPDSGFVDCIVLDRYALAPGFAISGPAVVEERESTTIVGPEAALSVDAQRNLLIEMQGT